MGLVTDTLIAQLSQQIAAHHVVVWYDPEQAYIGLASTLQAQALGGAALHYYNPARGFTLLRRELEPLWQQTQPPQLLIYVPIAQPANPMERALIEFEVAGVVMQPNQQPPERNTALANVVRAALSKVFPPAAVDDVVGQTAAGQLSLNELDDIAVGGTEAQTGAVAVIFGSGNAQDIALRLLTDPVLDNAIEKKQALPAIESLLTQAFGHTFVDNSSPQALRIKLARHLLLTDLLVAIGKDAPQALAQLPLPESKQARQTTVDLVHRWRNQRDLTSSYSDWAQRVQTEIGLTNIDIPDAALTRTVTFAVTERNLQTVIERLLANNPAPRQLRIAQDRLNGFWAIQDPMLKTRWEVIVNAGRVLLEAKRVNQGLKGNLLSAEQLIAHYAFDNGNQKPWCELDTVQRYLEREFALFELDPKQDGSLIKLVTRARQAYATATATLAENFTRAYAAAKFETTNIQHQVDVFHDHVTPLLSQQRVAYILVDALRFEMARELTIVIDSQLNHDLTIALATPPTVTEVGMAALMPGAENGLTLKAGNNGLVVSVDGTVLHTRKDRIKYLSKASAVTVIDVKLNQIAPLSNNQIQKKLEKAPFVLVTATEEIDTLCESVPTQAHRLLDDALNQLRRGINTLLKLGFETIVVSADHGYLFGEQLTIGEPIDAPGGNTVALKRRAWVGKGGADSPGTLRVPLAAFGLSSELELVTPSSLAIFKVSGGSMHYFHGGLSLQELIVPILTIRSKAAKGTLAKPKINWAIRLGSTAITTRFVSVTIQGSLAMFTDPPSVRVELRAGGQPVSVPVSAKYGLNETTKDVQLMVSEENAHVIAENTITLMITEDAISAKTVTLHLLDAMTGISLEQIEKIQVDITL